MLPIIMKWPLIVDANGVSYDVVVVVAELWFFGLSIVRHRSSWFERLSKAGIDFWINEGSSVVFRCAP